MQKPLAIICDLDGTLALRGDRDPFDYYHAIEDHVNWSVVKVVQGLWVGLRSKPCVILVVSGREEASRHVIEYWFKVHKILPQGRQGIYLRSTNDNRPDSEVKKEIYEKYIAPFYEVVCVFDDRDSVVKMWRDLDLLCLQVNYGNF